MKNVMKISIAVAFVFAIMIGLVNCTKHDQVIGTTTTPAPANDTLYSIKGTLIAGTNYQPQAAPSGYATAWNGDISGWANAPKLTVNATVPNPGGGYFVGFIGNSDSVTLQSMYDANNIYILMQWNAEFPNCASSPWYYNPKGTGYNYWAQEAGAPTQTAPGAATLRPAFIQDEVVMMFNISMPAFVYQSCYAACHAFSSYGSGDTTAGTAMWTSGPTEYLDCWRARTLQVLNANQGNDCDINNGMQTGLNGEINRNFVTSDPQANTTPNADGGFSNKQTLKVSGTGTVTVKVSVPMFVYPTGTYSIYPLSTYSNGSILLADTLSSSNHRAYRVTAVDTFGVLTISDGSTIDPRTSANGTNYQQVGMGDGPYCIPGSIVSAYTGDKADITTNMFWTGTGWRLLFVRALNTNHGNNPTTGFPDDIDFSSLKDQPFGFGVMFNGADNEHAIVTGLDLHFKK